MRKGFIGYAWFNVGYLIFVILWGAFVRATGSGAGCGRHWPTCNGEIVPRTEAFETMVEFGHRLTSGFAGVLLIGLVVWAFLAFKDRPAVRRYAVLSLVFVIIEGLIGAGLVLLELVEDNSSALRAGAIAVHLVNTLVLLTWVTLTAWTAMEASQRSRAADVLPRFAGPSLMAGLIAIAFLSATGAITALGDTLIMNNALAAGHFLEDLRVIHPFAAIGVSLGLLWLGRSLDRDGVPGMIRLATRAMSVLILVQLFAGALNIGLRAPVWMQLLHLLLADLLWIVMVVLGYEVRAAPQAQETRVAEPAPAGD